MMRIMFVFLFFSIGVGFPLAIHAQGKFKVSEIPEELKIKADAVIRADETIFTVEGISSGKEEKHWAITILNERGEDMHNRFVAYYDKLSKVKKIEGHVYNANGMLIKSLKGNEIIDIGLNAFSNEVGDARAKIAAINKKAYVYPYTIEFSYVSETDNMMFYPFWQPYENENTSLQNSSFTVITPDKFSFRMKEIAITKPVEIFTKSAKKYYTWKLENLPAYEDEPNTPPEIHPCVMTSPTEFEVEGYQGNIKEWEDISKFFYTLNKGRDILPEAVKAKVKDLVKGENDIKEKIKKLYEYMQSNTRYVSIQLGLGGWQTIEAKDVVTKGYGDCKALSNYMKALLNTAEIPAYVALVEAGSQATTVYSDFPCMRFNHVITCVPLLKDTIWLECTSQTNAMGYQGSFTGNRKALVITPEGGKLVNTTVYNCSDNKQIRKAKIKILENGTAQATVLTTYTGIQQDTRHGLMTELNQEEQKKWLVEHIHISSFELTDFSFAEKKMQVPQINEKLTLSIKKMATRSGSRFFLIPNLMTTFIDVPLMDKERQTDLFLDPNSYNFQDTDTLTYELPAGFVLEHLPDPVRIISKFGEYTSQTVVKDGLLLYYRNAIVKSGTYPKMEFKEWADFIKKISKSDRDHVVFTSKT